MAYYPQCSCGGSTCDHGGAWLRCRSCEGLLKLDSDGSVIAFVPAPGDADDTADEDSSPPASPAGGDA